MWQELFFKIRVIWDIIGFIILGILGLFFVGGWVLIKVSDYLHDRKRRKRK